MAINSPTAAYGLEINKALVNRDLSLSVSTDTAGFRVEDLGFRLLGIKIQYTQNLHNHN